MDLGLGQHKAAHHHDGQQGEAADSVGHHNAARQMADGPEQRHCHGMQQEQDEPIHKEPAGSTGPAAETSEMAVAHSHSQNEQASGPAGVNRQATLAQLAA